jgi:hypothetical protein
MIKPWLKVIFLGIFGKLIVKALAPVAVLFVDRQSHPVWGIRDATDLGYWNCAFRNSAHNMFTRPQVEFKSKQNTTDDTMEKLAGVQRRWRTSVDGQYVSYRRTWGKPRGKKGKKEFYVGWTMNEKPYMRLTFFQFRPF